MMLSCKKCRTNFDREVNFCTNCGSEIHKGSVKSRNESLNLIIIFYVVFLLFGLVSYLVYDAYPYSLNAEIAIECIFAILVIGFSITDTKSILKLYTIPILNWRVVVFTFLFPILSAFSVYFFIDFLNTSVFELISENYYASYAYLDNPLFWSVLFIAITPPIFEELAFRGFLFNQLRKVTSARVTIIATAFIFALVHFSMISLIWIFPFGLILGYIRHKYHTLWYGVIIHFIHNLIVLMLDYYYYNSEITDLIY